MAKAERKFAFDLYLNIKQISVIILFNIAVRDFNINKSLHYIFIFKLTFNRWNYTGYE